MLNTRPPWFRRPWALELTGLAAVAALVAIIAGTRPWQRTEVDPDDVTRAGGPPPIALVKPIAGVPFDRTFSWRPVDGASSYRVVVFTSDGERSFEVRDVKGTGVAVSASVKLAPGRYFWQVVATGDGATIAESPRTAFEIPDP